MWGSLRLAIELLREGDVGDAQGVLDASGVTVPTGDLVDGCYDEQGALYQLPAWVVAEPLRIVEDDGKEIEAEEDIDHGYKGEEEEEPDGDKGKEVVGVGDGIKVKCRLSDRGGPDVVVLVGRKERVGELVKKVQREAGVRLLWLSYLDENTDEIFAGTGQRQDKNRLFGKDTKGRRNSRGAGLEGGTCD